MFILGDTLSTNTQQTQTFQLIGTYRIYMVTSQFAFHFRVLDILFFNMKPTNNLRRSR